MELEKGNGINFIPCLTWVRRGVAKPDPEHVKLTSEELSSVIAQQKNNLKEQEEEEGEGDAEETADKAAGMDDEVKVKVEKEEGKDKTEEDIMKEYGLEDYVYNDVEDALYVHHDIQLPAFPLALEWLPFDPESDTRGSLVAVVSMSPVIEVWALALVDCLEPAFKLGRKARKKKKIAGVGHTEAVLALSWNSQCEHVLASGGADHKALLWDLNNQTVVSSLS